MLALAMVPLVTPRALGRESLSELQARMDSLQAELNAAQSRIEDLRTEQDVLRERMRASRSRMTTIEQKQKKLRSKVVARAQELYMDGNSEMLEAFFGSDDIGDLMDKTEVLSQVSLDESGSFVALARSQAELTQLEEQWAADSERLKAAESQLAEENGLLQSRFEEVSSEYESLKAALMKQAPAPAPAPAQASVASTSSAPVVRSSGGMACPVGGATSFIDSWGYPRSGGRSHQGVDMMASYGTPIVAITDGTITLSDYGDSAGYWQILSGDDGHQYWYMHNERNIVNGGRVSAGQQIATVGDSGNAAGTPHLHFEYHPGGGSATNPYPLVASLC